EKTGIPIPGTATFRVAPNCNFENDREMKGCPFQMKRRFLVDLMGDLTEERKVALRAKNNESSIGPEDNLSLRETVARWKLKTLDANGNGILERKEWRPIRRTTLKNRNYPRKCRRNFLRYCDEDDNKRITYEEWKACLGLNDFVGLSPENNFNSLPLNPQRTGKNPFVDQLT
ncbi:sparc-related modular calcium-binding protein 1-like isoform x2, partial [Plakobranchus ocellatus]